MKKALLMTTALLTLSFAAYAVEGSSPTPTPAATTTTMAQTPAGTAKTTTEVPAGTTAETTVTTETPAGTATTTTTTTATPAKEQPPVEEPVASQPRDAITGKPIDEMKEPEQEEESLRDRVREKIGEEARGQ